MSDSTADQYLGADAAERLLDVAARGDDSADDPLTALLVAAATPERGRALAGEAAAVAAFRAAQQPTPTPTVAHRRTVRAAAAAALAAVALGGVAMAADRAGLPLPRFHHQPAPASPSPQGHPSPAGPHPSGASTAAAPDSGAAPHAASPSRNQHATQGQNSGKSRKQHGGQDYGQGPAAKGIQGHGQQSGASAHPHVTKAS
jgi:hypothetical protein